MLEEAVRQFQLAAVLASEFGELEISDPGTSLIKGVAIVLCVITILLVGYKIIVKRERLANLTTRWILLIAFLLLSPLAYFMIKGELPAEK